MKNYMTKVDEPDDDAGELVPFSQQDIAPSHQPSDIDVQIKTAIATPRDVVRATSEAKMLFTDPGIAQSAWYTLERVDRKTGEKRSIMGPSIRLAEVMAYTWRNVRFGSNVVEVGKTAVTVEGICIDLERNVAARVTVSRPIVTRYGKRYGEDMISVTTAAASALAIRNAIFKVIPGAFVKPVLAHAMEVSRMASSQDFGPRLAAALKWFADQGATEREVLDYVGKKQLADLGVEDLMKLRGLWTAIQEGETSIEATFKAPRADRARKEAEKTAAPAPAADTHAETRTKPAAAVPEDPTPKPVLTPTERIRMVLGKDAEKAATILQALVPDDGDLEAVLSAPKSIILAALRDENPQAALGQIAAASQKGLGV